MVTYITMPKFGLSMEEGTIASWFFCEGDMVKIGDELAEINSEKITNVIEAPVNGIIRKILTCVNETSACGVNIAIIADTLEEKIVETPIVSKKTEKTEEAETNEPSLAPKSLSGILITPRAKKIADDKGIDYSAILGTGIGGAITIDDLKTYSVPNAEPAKIVKKNFVPAETIVTGNEKRMSQMQNMIAKKMFESMNTTAQTTISMEADVTDLSKIYNERKAIYAFEGYKLTYTAIVIKAVALALESHPKLRNRIVGENLILTENEINIGIAVDVEDGLVVPIIKNANLKHLKLICKELDELAEKARTNKLEMSEMSGGVFTITNLGMFGITTFTPIINIPESAILGIGSIREQLVIKNGSILTNKLMNMSLTHDHRIINGAPAARFLQDVNTILSDFEKLL